MSKMIFGPTGGVSGTPFDDTPPYNDSKIKEIRVWSGTCIEALQSVHAIDGEAVEGKRHGGRSGHLGVMKLADDEYVIEIYGRYASYIESLNIRTNHGQVRRFGGQGGHAEFIYTAPSGFQIIGFWGRAGHLLDAIGVHITPVLKTG